MGRIARLLSFTRRVVNGITVNDSKVNPAGGDNITAETFSPVGDDAYPLPQDYAALSSDDGEGRESVVGWLDPVNAPKTAAGEKRIYGRDSGSGASVVELWLKNDGTAILSNSAGSITLKPDGTIEHLNGSGTLVLQADGVIFGNGATIDTSGNITSPATITAPNIVANTSLTINGKEMKDHTHPAGTPPGNTGPNN